MIDMYHNNGTYGRHDVIKTSGLTYKNHLHLRGGDFFVLSFGIFSLILGKIPLL